MNCTLPFGSPTLKLCLPWASLSLLFLFSWQKTWLGPCSSGKREWKVTCVAEKYTCPWRLDGPFLYPEKNNGWYVQIIYYTSLGIYEICYKKKYSIAYWYNEALILALFLWHVYLWQVNQLVEEETRRYRPTKNYLDFLATPDYEAFEVRAVIISCFLTLADGFHLVLGHLPFWSSHL